MEWRAALTQSCPVEREPNLSLSALQKLLLQFAGSCPCLPQTEWARDGHHTSVVNLSMQALRIFSGVAGLSSRKSSFVLSVC